MAPMSSIAALDLPSSSSSSMCGSVSSRSISSRSVRRRDVIKGIKLDEDSRRDDLNGTPSRDDSSNVGHIGDVEINSNSGSGGKATDGSELSPTSVLDNNNTPAENVPSNALVLHPTVHNRALVAANNSTELVPAPENRFVLAGQPEPDRRFVMMENSSTQIVTHSSTNRHSNSDRSSGHNSALKPERKRGMEPDEVVRGADRQLVLADAPADPPGEEPSDRPVVCLDLVPVNDGNSVGSGSTGSSFGGSRDASGSHGGRNARGGNNCGGGGRKAYRQVQWVDPKNVSSLNDVDHSVLRQYEDLVDGGEEAKDADSMALIPSTDSRALVPVDPDGSAFSPHDHPPRQSDQFQPSQPTPTELLLSNPRTRIATISSGYKKANFFVREDLDTRIYFHQLEDAVGYMARRGYARMRGEEEGEWRELLGRAHGVVKVGPKKEKQRYRKGRLVMILKKTVTDDDNGDPAYSSKNKSKRKQRKSRHSSNESESSSQVSGSRASTYTDSTSMASTSTHTERTSLGKSIRGPYKSYSEKFLAQQEEEKKRYLLAIMEGRPLEELDADLKGNGGQLLLTDGSTTTGPVDPDADSQVTGSEGTSTQASGYTSTVASTQASKSKKSEQFGSSARRGVYGGGVRYFTPDKSYEDDEDSEEEDEDFEEEEDDCTESQASESRASEYSESQASRSVDSRSEASSAVEVDGSDMGSMLSTDYSYHQNQSGGVQSIDGSEMGNDEDETSDCRAESVTTMSTGEQNECLRYKANDSVKGMRNAGKDRGRRGRRPPEMAPISDDSASSSSR